MVSLTKSRPDRPGLTTSTNSPESDAMTQCYRLLMISALALFGNLLAAATVAADDYYFAMILGSQSQPKRLRYTHTWVTLAHAQGEGPDLSSYNLELSTISWLPATLDVKVLRPWPEPGVNLDLYQTIQAVQDKGESITMWGPFVVRPECWPRSLFVRGILESGRAEYRAISTARNLLISDCIHAAAAMDPVFGRGHYPLVRIGKPASRHMAHQLVMRSVFDQYLYNNAWLVPRLGLDRYGIEVVPPRAIARAPCGLCKLPD
jgi:hypothetical protein